MSKIIINNTKGGVINIYNVNESPVSEARDTLLTKLYYARNKDTMGGREAWLQLLDWYYMGDYQAMYDLIKACKGRGGKTRHDCLECLNIIMKGGK